MQDKEIYKELVKNYQKELKRQQEIDDRLYSTCCGELPEGNVHELDNEHFGNCGKCKEHTDFERIEQ